ncbi:hypothetical protein LINGRAHAP2_LOCUS33608 [Linum grandiflorum]
MENSLICKISILALFLLVVPLVSSTAEVEGVCDAAPLMSRKVGISGKARSDVLIEPCKTDKDCCKYCSPRCKGKQVDVQCFGTGYCYCGC